MPWWAWLTSGAVLGYGMRVFEMLRHETRCPELKKLGTRSDAETVRCRLHDGHPGPCEAKYKVSSVDLMKTIGHWDPESKK